MQFSAAACPTMGVVVSINGSPICKTQALQRSGLLGRHDVKFTRGHFEVCENDGMANDVRNWKFPVYINTHLTHQTTGYRALARQACLRNTSWLGQSRSILCWVHVDGT
ncbi:hypothetical protein P692DRAFT_207606 [Suillus brevipes Sb2]|nr:hypothetical protein P692DRAFT_207606 [Suillus brevipes Sb2]